MSDIHEMFHANDAEAPSSAEWADKARAKRQRRRVGTGVAAAVLAVGLAIPIGTTLLNRPVQVAAPAESPTPAPVPLALDVCGDAEAAVQERDPMNPSGDGVKEGATRVWLCGDQSWFGPSEPLTEGVGDAVSAFLAEPKIDGTQACTMEYRMAYTAVFEYEDGSTVPVRGELHGCRTLNDGASLRSGGEGFLQKLTYLWKEQRNSATYEDKVRRLCSDQSQPIIPFDPQRISGVQTCTQEGDSWTTTVVTSLNDTEIQSNGQLADAVEESMKDAKPAGATETLEAASPGFKIQVIDKFGGRMTLEALRDGRYSFTGDNGTPMVWEPTEFISTFLTPGR